MDLALALFVSFWLGLTHFPGNDKCWEAQALAHRDQGRWRDHGSQKQAVSSVTPTSHCRLQKGRRTDSPGERPQLERLRGATQCPPGSAELVPARRSSLGLVALAPESSLHSEYSLALPPSLQTVQSSWQLQGPTKKQPSNFTSWITDWAAGKFKSPALPAPPRALNHAHRKPSPAYRRPRPSQESRLRPETLLATALPALRITQVLQCEVKGAQRPRLMKERGELGWKLRNSDPATQPMHFS